VDARSAHVEIASAQNTHDSRFGTSVFELARALLPGERIQLHFDVVLARGGVRASGFEYDVASNGTVMSSNDVMPAIGYRAGFELRDLVARRKQRLSAPPTPLLPLPSPDTGVGSAPVQPNAAWLTLDATISTSADQTAFASGRLVRSWTHDGRRYFRYVMAAPMTPLYAFVSGRYAERRVKQNGVEVAVWYHEAHGMNVDTILNAARTSLAIFGARYGPYPFHELRIVEVPSWSDFGALALSGTILFTEDRGFLSDPRPGNVDLVTRRVAHEVAHQWWPDRLDPADVVGSAFLVESLAKYGEQLVIESMHGGTALAEMLAFDEDRYLSGRTDERGEEPTLLQVTNQAYLYYGKGAIVMNGIRDLLGSHRLDAALVQLLAEHAGPQGAATTLDFSRILQTNASAEQRTLIDEWLGGTTVYDLKVDTATVRAGEDGRYRADVSFHAIKSVRAGAAEADQPVTGERIDVVLLDDASPANTLCAGTVLIDAGRATMSVVLPSRPTHVVIDPFIRRIDRERSNNRKRFVPRAESPGPAPGVRESTPQLSRRESPSGDGRTSRGSA
jgi:hypothetical protein